MTVLDPNVPLPDPPASPDAGPDEPRPDVGTDPRPRRPRLLDATAIAATVGVVAALVGVVALALPVQSPIQDCGTTFAFLREGRLDTYADPADPPKGTTRAEVEAAMAKPCRDRAADRARTAAYALAGGLMVVIGAVLVEVVARARLRRHRNPGHGRGLGQPAPPPPPHHIAPPDHTT